MRYLNMRKELGSGISAYSAPISSTTEKLDEMLQRLSASVRMFERLQLSKFNGSLLRGA